MKLNKLNRHISITLIWLVVTLPFASAQMTSPPALSITNVQLNHGAQTIITWQTNALATGYVEWGNTSALGTNTTTPQGTLHTATLNTIPGQTYFYKIVSCETTCASTQIDSFTAGPLFITTSIAPYVRNANIDIPGRTRAGAKVELYVNSILVRQQNTSTEAFVFRNVQLQTANNVTLKSFLGNETAEKNFTIRVDSEPPKITVDIPKIATQPSVVARVTTTEPVNITIKTRRVDASPPGRPTALTKKDVTNNRVELSWTNASGATEYLVRRDGIVIGKTITNTYADTIVGADKQYDYEIIAVNAACMQSEPSATLAVTTPGGTNTQGQVTETKPTCERDAQSYLITASADITVNLVEGENLVTFTATDAAGFESIIEESVIYDLAPPQFLEQNLGSLNPSYSMQVVVRGKLSEKGSVTVYINDKPVETKKTEDDGSFTIPVMLERNVQVKTDKLAAGLNTGVGYSNKMQLEATDSVGQKTRTEKVDVNYAICGYGTDFDVKIENPVPDVLNPRLLYEGIQQVGIAFTYEYKGTYNAVVAPGSVRVTPIQLSPAVAKEYDNNIVTISSQSRAKRGKEKTAGEGYVQATFTPIKDPWTQFGEGKKPNNPTLYDIEDAIASHRMAYKDLKIKDCKTPGVGCMRLFLKLEIPYQITTQSQQYLPEQPLAGQIQPEQKTQITCIDVELAIDRRIPPDLLPQGFLKGMSETLGAIIEGVDTVLKPLRTIYQYLFYTCLAGLAVVYVPTVLEKYNCEYSALATAVSGEGKFDEGVAAINACSTEYEGQQKSLDNCKACATWKKNKKWVTDVYKQICDRASCPAAPSLQHYIKSRANQQLKEINAPKATAKLTRYTAKTGGKLYQGSDCAAWMQEKNKQITGQDAKIPPSTLFSSADIESIYQDWIKHKSDTRTADEQQGVVNCAAPHPATPECCGYEYMNEWGSACGIGGTLVGQGIDTFDEIEQSTCLSAEKANKKTIGEGDKAVSCGGISNALAGFCTAEGTEPIDYIRVTTFTGSPTETTGRLAELGIGKASDQYLYILLIPSKGAATNYDIKLGYLVEDIEFMQTEQGKKLGAQGKHEIDKKMRAIEMTSPSIAEYFSQQNIDNYHAGKLNADVYNKLQTTLCSAAGKTTGCDVNGKTIYDAVMSKIGKPDQEYIIDPRKGIINAIRCICLPAVISYLQLWRNIMAAAKNCIDAIRFTGDGNPGTCQEAISKYACDLIYEALACFTEKFTAGGGRPGGKDIFGALTSAGTEMSNDIQGRYGQNSMYSAVFSQGQIVKAVCTFAFTGTWSMDFAALADQSLQDFPIESQPFMYPCDRRFVSFNPLTTPPGMTTWIYHFGVFIAAGSDIDIEFALKCSGGYKCSENDGFERGKCDCDTEKILTIAPPDLPTRAKKNEIVDSAIYYTVAGSPIGNIRYDKAILTYKWKDAQGKEQRKPLECRINQLGGAPNFCRFDMFSGAYRCQFGPEQGGIQLSNPEVIYPHNISASSGSPPVGVYALNENLNINVPIRQVYTGKVSETKFLRWEIKGPGGAAVANNKDSAIKLDINGDYTKNIGQGKFDVPVRLIKEWFGGATSAGGQTTTSTYWHTGLTTPTTANWIANAQYLENGVAYQGNKQFVVEKEGTYKVYQAASSTAVNANLGFTSADKQRQLSCTQQQNTLDCTIAPGANEVSPPSRRLIVSLGTQFPNQPKLQAHINIGLITASGDFCTGDNKYKPVTFTMNIAAYDGNELGQITDMIAINPTTNEEAKTTTTFQAVCVDANDQKFKDMETLAKGQTPAIAGINKWIELKKQLEKMYTMEKGYIEQLTKLQEQSTSNPSAFVSQAGELGNTIQQIQQAETTELTKLTNLVAVPTNDGTTTPSAVKDLVIGMYAAGEDPRFPAGSPSPAYLAQVVAGLSSLHTNITTSIIQQGEYANFMTSKVNEAIAILSWIQPQKALAINSLNKNLGINVCEVGYKNGVTTGCFASKPNDPLWTETGATCPTGKCYQGIPKLYVGQGEKEIIKEMSPLLPGDQIIVAKIPAIKQTDITGVELLDTPIINEYPQQKTGEQFVNNVLKVTFKSVPVQSWVSYKLKFNAEGNAMSLYYPIVDVQKTIGVAASEFEPLIRNQLLEQSDKTLKTGYYFAQQAKIPAFGADQKTAILEAVTSAKNRYTVMKNSPAFLDQARYTTQAWQLVSAYKSQLDTLVSQLGAREATLNEPVVPGGWPLYLKQTVDALSQQMNTVFTTGLTAHDSLLPVDKQNFLVNGQTTLNINSQQQLTATSDQWCIYPTGAHYFDAENCFANKIAEFPTYLKNSNFGTKQARGKSGSGTNMQWTNPVQLTYGFSSSATSAMVIEYSTGTGGQPDKYPGTYYLDPNIGASQTAGVYQIPAQANLWRAKTAAKFPLAQSPYLCLAQNGKIVDCTAGEFVDQGTLSSKNKSPLPKGTYEMYFIYQSIVGGQSVLYKVDPPQYINFQ